MFQFVASVIFGQCFSIGVLVINAYNNNPLRLTRRGIYTTAVLALLVGVGIFQLAINFNFNCNQTGCFVHWGNPLGE